MHLLNRYTLMAALALCSIPVTVPAGEAPATSAAAARDAEMKLTAAQQRLDAAAREVAELSSQMGPFYFSLVNGSGGGPPPRALLGINVDVNSTRDGARVMDVSPGGAAAEAGVKPGDLITAIADLDLTKDSNPARALVEKMNQLQPDQKVKLAVLRDGKKLSFDIAPRPAPQDVLVRRQELRGGGRGPDVLIGQGPGARGPGAPGPNGPGANGPGPNGPGPNGPGPGGQGAGQNVRQFIIQGEPGRNGQRNQVQLEFRGDDSETRFGGAELASLSERLGSYFGVKAGVLVVRAGVDSQFKLQDGDVILAVDGREITSAQQAGRILRSYQPGEKLTLKVQRDRKVQNLEIAAPGGRRPN